MMPQIAAIGGVVDFVADGRPVKAVASPFNLFGTPMTVDRPPPGLGADTDRILRDFGFSGDAVAALREQGALVRRPRRRWLDGRHPEGALTARTSG